LLKSQLAKAGVSLRDASEDGQPLTEQQQQLLYRIEIPGGVALVRSYDVSEDPYKVEEVDLYGILLK
jgi:hypothetical protein